MSRNDGLPADVKAEQASLGAILLDGLETMGRVSEVGLTDGDFYREPHSLIFKAMREHFERGEPVDVITLAETLKRDGCLDKIGGYAYLSELSDAVGTSANVEHYARIILEKSALRKVIQGCRRVMDLAASPRANYGEVMDQVTSLFPVSNVSTGQQCQQGEHLSAPVSNGQQLVSNFVSNWGEDAFSPNDIFAYIGAKNRAEKNTVYQALTRMVKAGEIERSSHVRGGYRKINRDCEKMDFRNVELKTDPIHLPFGLEKLVTIQPGDVIVLAGESGVGKTTIALNLIYINNNRYQEYKSRIKYFSSEIRDVALKERLLKFDIPFDRWDFEAYSRSHGFQDVIDPEGLNIIDYLEFTTSEFFKVAEYLRQIHDKLTTGIAFVCLQKSPGQDVGRGGHLSLEKPALYLSVSRHPESGGVLKVVKARNWATSVSPIGMQVRYKIISGASLYATNAWAKPEGRKR